LVGSIARDRGCEAVDVLVVEHVRCRNSATLTQHYSTSFDPAVSPPIESLYGLFPWRGVTVGYCCFFRLYRYSDVTPRSSNARWF
jgi:hypothetical protein